MIRGISSVYPVPAGYAGQRLPIVLSQCAVPIGIAPTGTMGANGALTAGTAFNVTYTGIWLYFPAGAVSAGSAAGFYWTVMTNTTAGTVYTNTYTPGGSFAVPASPTAVSDAGPGGYAGVTAETVSFSVTVPGGMLGVNGGLQAYLLSSNNNSGTTKVIGATFGGTALTGASPTTTLSNGLMGNGRNRGVANSQVWNPSMNLAIGASASAITPTSIDTASPATYSVTLRHATATDIVVLEQFHLIAFPSG